MTELFMIRHGQASFHADDYDILSALGVKQVQVMARYMLKAGLVPDRIFCGTMRRHRETLQAMQDVFMDNGTALPEAFFTDSMREYDHGTLIKALIPVMVDEDPSLDGILDRVRQDPVAFQRFFRQVMDRWLRGNYPPGDIESWDAFRKRVMDGIESIRTAESQTKKIFLITSGGPVSIAAGAALDLSPYRTVRLGWEIVNASVSRFKLGAKGPVLSVFNAYSFLEEEGGDYVTYR